MKRRAHHVGRLRTKLANMLIREMQAQHKLRLTITPDRINPAQGRNRSDARLDVYRWEAFGAIHIAGGSNPEGITCTIDSWDTITACVKHGITISRERAYQFDAYANEPPKGTA